MKPRPNNPTRNLRHQPQWPVSLLVLLLLLTGSPGMAAVRAGLDRSTVYAGDVFTLIIESDNQSSGQQPNLAPLEKDFEVLGTRTSTQVSIINGRRSDKTQWHVQLQPRRIGQRQIPPIDVGGEKTAAIPLEIIEAPQQTAAQAGQHVFIETEASTDGKPVYVQQQIPYTVRLYYDDRLQEGELSAPEPENAVVERLGKERRYDTQRNGRQYHVIERNYVISAEKSGALTIPPALFRGRIAVPQQDERTRRANSPMEEFLKNSPFANDPFFRNRLGDGLFGNPGRPITVRSRPLDLQIKPRPATASHDWLPAEAVSLSDSWTENPPQFRAGEPVSRTITLQTKGLSGSQIPELTITAPAGTRLYPETSTQENRTDGMTIYGVRTQTLTYIAGTQGMLDIPAITLDWWDTRHDEPTRSTLPAWQFNVLPGTPGTASEVQTAIPSPATQTAMSAGTTNGKATQTEPSLVMMIREAIQTNRHGLMIAGGGLLLIIILSVILTQRAKRRHSAAVPASQKTASQTAGQGKQAKSALRQLKKACAANDRQTAARALLSLAHRDWPDDPPHSLGALAARIEKGRIQLRELDRSLYAAEATDWNGAALWHEFRHGLPGKKVAGLHRDDELRPLYPQHP